MFFDSEARPRSEGDDVVDLWIRELAQRGAPAAVGPRDQIRYTIDVAERDHERSVRLAAFVVPVLKNGVLGTARRYELISLVSGNHSAIVPLDRTIGRLAAACRIDGTTRELPPAVFGMLLDALMQSERLHWRSLDDDALRRESIPEATIVWTLGEDGLQRPRLENRDSAILLPSAPLWYVDPDRHVAGPVHVDLQPEMAALLASAPALSPAQAERAQIRLHHIFLANGVDGPSTSIPVLAIDENPVPVLRLAGREPPERLTRYASEEKSADRSIAIAELTFAYGERIIAPGDAVSEFRHASSDSGVVVWPRRSAFEQQTLEELRQLGFADVTWPYNADLDPQERVLHFPASPEKIANRWLRFLTGTLPELRARGWRIEREPSFPYTILENDEPWRATLSQDEHPQWFDLELGIEIEGQRVSLLPVLLNALSSELLNFSSAPAAIAKRKTPFFGKLPNGKYIAFAPERVARLLAILGGLFSEGERLSDDRVRVPAVRAVALAEDAGGLAWSRAASLNRLAGDLARYRERKCKPPRTFKGELRPYQQDGLAWLQTLREHGLGGVLADDMGLGKTVQVLAHIAVERAAKRLKAPVLVVAPTSVIPNWRAEIARFLPSARVVSLTGPARAAQFRAVAQADIALTSYALLQRDTEPLAKMNWSIVVLDEAQAIKNPRAKVTTAALRLRATQPLALTGTPIENHLEELWSLYAFAVPGLLPDRSRFARVFRTPIEKHGDELRRGALAAWIRPFLLRRTKEQVERDLPKKTEILQRIELTGAQRDLYETVRLAMHKRVRDEVERRGLGRSRIVVLDALLKLRQICCDPRLLKMPEAAHVRESQKLDALMEMLESLIEDGRRILLFSQFTSMLDLIKTQLVRRRIAFEELRGDTRDRETPVARFQSGSVPLFLISLKAGGTGLNLTAADTVIHYDPWWNPAVERQATDRAHRIGQQKHVFVYKLIAEGTVEERILELQERKGRLAAGLFDDAASAEKLGENLGLDLSDLERLFS